MTCGDLFAGIGGMSLGLERAGFTVCWQVEKEPYCENILRRHWPHVPRRRDVRFAGGHNLEPVDLVAGGFPCQDVSVAGRGVGLAGHRSGLWREFARIIGELRPRWVLVENVPALRGRGADTVLSDLEAAHYACSPLVVGARHIGAPHRRDRVWIVGQLGDAEGGGRTAERECGDAQESVALRDGVADTDDAGCGKLGGPRTAAAECCPAQRRCFPAGRGEAPYDWEPARTVESPLGVRAHGVSGRLARAKWRQELMALGNAVVPQVVEVIGRAILAVEDACGA